MRFARRAGRFARRPEAAVDATGLESRHVSRYFAKRSRVKFRRYPKLTVVCDTATHLWAAAAVHVGPCNDSPAFAPVMRQAADAARWDRVLADGAYDSEAHHRLCREELGVRSTVIPVNGRGRRKWPKTKYRRQMRKRFHKVKYGQRWQVESAFSRHKRLLGAELRGRSPESQERECLLRVLVHDVMLLAVLPRV
jgi:transposase